MRCPECNTLQQSVIDSRPQTETNTIRRRRECEKCKNRWTTYEIEAHGDTDIVGMRYQISELNKMIDKLHTQRKALYENY